MFKYDFRSKYGKKQEICRGGQMPFQITVSIFWVPSTVDRLYHLNHNLLFIMDSKYEGNQSCLCAFGNVCFALPVQARSGYRKERQSGVPCTVKNDGPQESAILACPGPLG